MKFIQHIYYILGSKIGIRLLLCIKYILYGMHMGLLKLLSFDIFYLYCEILFYESCSVGCIQEGAGELQDGSDGGFLLWAG